jgi:hypothetical protein
MNPELADEPPPGFPGLDLNDLRNLSFDTGDKAVDYLKAQAKAHGFKLSLRDSVASDRIRLLCHRADYGKGTKTTKTGCEVRAKLLKRDNHYYIKIKDRICHNHPLLTPPPEDLPEPVAKAVSDLIAVGLPNIQIVQFIEKQTGQLFSTADIAAMRRPQNQQALISETDAVLDSLELDDDVFLYEVMLQGESHRAGMLLITKWERANLERFGDVVWLDGTSLKNDLGWTTWPVTLCDDRKQLASGGVFFTAFENEEAFLWLLQTLEGVLGPRLKTIFTDEDSALCPAMATFQQDIRPDVAHRLCYWHKRRNFQNQLDRARVAPEVRDQALLLFDRLCRCPSEAEAEEAITKIRLLVPSISEYLEREVCSRLRLFTEAFRAGALTLGYCATGLSESANSFIRRILPAKILTLLEIRNGITKAYQIKDLGTERTISHERQQVELLEAEYGVKLQRPLLRWVDLLLNQAKRCTITMSDAHGPEGSEARFFEAAIKGHRSWLIKLEGDMVQCECDHVDRTGLPCHHLVALFQQGGNGAFPVQLIDRRWIANFEAARIPRMPAIRIEEADLAQRIASDSRTSDEEDGDHHSNDDCDRHQSDDEVPASDSEDDELPPPGEVPPAHSPAQSRRYQVLQGLGKQIAQKAASNAERFDDIRETLVGVLESLTESCDGQVRDARGRPKGRPPKHGHSQPQRSQGPKSRCLLCKSDAHRLNKCPHYPVFEDERRKYQGTTEGRQCSLCHYAGHRKDKCPVLKLAKHRVAEEIVAHRRH